MTMQTALTAGAKLPHLSVSSVFVVVICCVCYVASTASDTLSFDRYSMLLSLTSLHSPTSPETALSHAPSTQYNPSVCVSPCPAAERRAIVARNYDPALPLRSFSRRPARLFFFAIPFPFVFADAADQTLTSPGTRDNVDIGGVLTVAGLDSSEHVEIGPSVTMTGLTFGTTTGATATVTHSTINGALTINDCEETTLLIQDTTLQSIVWAPTTISTRCVVTFERVTFANALNSITNDAELSGVTLTFKDMDLRSNTVVFKDVRPDGEKKTEILFNGTTWESTASTTSKVIHAAGMIDSAVITWRKATTAFTFAGASGGTTYTVISSNTLSGNEINLEESTFTFDNVDKLLFYGPGSTTEDTAVTVNMRDTVVSHTLETVSAAELSFDFFSTSTVADHGHRVTVNDSVISSVATTTGALGTATMKVLGYPGGIAELTLHNATITAYAIAALAVTPTIVCLPVFLAHPTIGTAVFTIEDSTITLFKSTGDDTQIGHMLTQGTRNIALLVNSSTINVTSTHNVHFFTKLADSDTSTTTIHVIDSTLFADGTVGADKIHGAFNVARTAGTIFVKSTTLTVYNIVGTTEPARFLRMSSSGPGAHWSSVRIEDVTISTLNSLEVLRMPVADAVPTELFISGLDVIPLYPASVTGGATLHLIHIVDIPVRVTSVVLRRVQALGPWTASLHTLPAQLRYTTLEITDSHFMLMRPSYDHFIADGGSMLIRNVSSSTTFGSGTIGGHKVVTTLRQVAMTFDDVKIGVVAFEAFEESTIEFINVTSESSGSSDFSFNPSSGTPSYKSTSVLIEDCTVSDTPIDVGPIVPHDALKPGSNFTLRGSTVKGVRANPRLNDEDGEMLIEGVVFTSSEFVGRFNDRFTLRSITLRNSSVDGATPSLRMLEFTDAVVAASILVQGFTAHVGTTAFIKILQFDDTVDIGSVLCEEVDVQGNLTDSTGMRMFQNAAAKTQHYDTVHFLNSRFVVTSNYSIRLFRYQNTLVKMPQLTFEGCTFDLETNFPMTFVEIRGSARVRQVVVNGSTSLRLAAIAGLSAFDLQFRSDAGIDRYLRFDNATVDLVGPTGSTVMYYVRLTQPPADSELIMTDTNVTAQFNKGKMWSITGDSAMKAVTVLRSNVTHTGTASAYFFSDDSTDGEWFVDAFTLQDSVFVMNVKKMYFLVFDHNRQIKFEQVNVVRTTFSVTSSNQMQLMNKEMDPVGYGFGKVLVDGSTFDVTAVCPSSCGGIVQHVLGFQFASTVIIPGERSLTVRDTSIAVREGNNLAVIVLTIYAGDVDAVLLDNVSATVRTAGHFEFVQTYLAAISVTNMTVQNCNLDIQNSPTKWIYAFQGKHFSGGAVRSDLEQYAHVAFIDNNFTLRGSSSSSVHFFHRENTTQVTTMVLRRNIFDVTSGKWGRIFNLALPSGYGVADFTMENTTLSLVKTTTQAGDEVKLFCLRFTETTDYAAGVPRQFIVRGSTFTVSSVSTVGDLMQVTGAVPNITLSDVDVTVTASGGPFLVASPHTDAEVGTISFDRVVMSLATSGGHASGILSFSGGPVTIQQLVLRACDLRVVGSGGGESELIKLMPSSNAGVRSVEITDSKLHSESGNKVKLMRVQFAGPSPVVQISGTAVTVSGPVQASQSVLELHSHEPIDSVVIEDSSLTLADINNIGAVGVLSCLKATADAVVGIRRVEWRATTVTVRSTAPHPVLLQSDGSDCPIEELVAEHSVFDVETRGSISIMKHVMHGNSTVTATNVSLRASTAGSSAAVDVMSPVVSAFGATVTLSGVTATGRAVNGGVVRVLAADNDKLPIVSMDGTTINVESSGAAVVLSAGLSTLGGLQHDMNVTNSTVDLQATGSVEVFHAPSVQFGSFNLSDVTFTKPLASYFSVDTSKASTVHIGIHTPVVYTYQVQISTAATIGLGPSTNVVYAFTALAVSKDLLITGDIKGGAVRLTQVQVDGLFVNDATMVDSDLTLDRTALMQCQHLGNFDNTAVTISWVRARCMEDATTMDGQDRAALAFGTLSGSTTVLVENSEVYATAAGAGVASACSFDEASVAASVTLSNLTIQVSGATAKGATFGELRTKRLNLTDNNVEVRSTAGAATALFVDKLVGPSSSDRAEFVIGGGACDVESTSGPAQCAALDGAVDVESFTVANGTRRAVSPGAYAIAVGCVNEGTPASIRNIFVSDEAITVDGGAQGSGAVMFRPDMIDVESVLVDGCTLTATTTSATGQAYAVLFKKGITGGADSSLTVRNTTMDVSNTGTGKAAAVLVQTARIQKIVVDNCSVAASVAAAGKAPSALGIMEALDATLAVSFSNTTVTVSGPASMADAAVLHVLGGGTVTSVSVENVVVVGKATAVPLAKLVAPKLALTTLQGGITITGSTLAASSIHVDNIGAVTLADTTWSSLADIGTSSFSAVDMARCESLDPTQAMSLNLQSTSGGAFKVADVRNVGTVSLSLAVGTSPVSITNTVFSTSSVSVLLLSVASNPVTVVLDNITVVPTSNPATVQFVIGVPDATACPTCRPIPVTVSKWVAGNKALPVASQTGSTQIVFGGEFASIAVSDVEVLVGALAVQVGQFNDATPLVATAPPTSVTIARTVVHRGYLGVNGHLQSNVSGCISIVDSAASRTEAGAGDFAALYINNAAAASVLARGNRAAADQEGGAALLVATRSVGTVVVEDNVVDAGHFRVNGAGMSVQVHGLRGVAHARRNNVTCLGDVSCTALHFLGSGQDLVATGGRGNINGPARLFVEHNTGRSSGAGAGGLIVGLMPELSSLDGVRIAHNDLKVTGDVSAAAAGLHAPKLKRIGMVDISGNAAAATCNSISRGFSFEKIAASRVSVSGNDATIGAAPLGHSGVVLADAITDASQVSIMQNRFVMTEVPGIPSVVSIVEGGKVDGNGAAALTITGQSAVFIHQNDLSTDIAGVTKEVVTTVNSQLIDGAGALRLAAGCNTINNAAVVDEWKAATHTSATAAKIAKLTASCASACVGTATDRCPVGPGSGSSPPTLNATSCACTCSGSAAGFPADFVSVDGPLSEQCVSPAVTAMAVVRPETCSGFTVLNPPEAAGLRAKVTGAFSEQARIHFTADREMLVSVAPGATVQLDVMAVDGFGRPLSATHAPLLAAHLSVAPAATSIAESGTAGVIRVTLTASTPSQRFLISAKMDAVSPRVYLPGGGYVSLRTGLPCTSLKIVDMPSTLDFAVPMHIAVKCLDARNATADWMMTYKANTTLAITGADGEWYAVARPMMGSRTTFLLAHPPTRVAARVDGSVTVAVAVDVNGGLSVSRDLLLCGNTNGLKRVDGGSILTSPMIDAGDPVAIFSSIGAGQGVTCSIPGGPSVLATHSGCTSMCALSLPGGFTSGRLQLTTARNQTVSAGMVVSGSMTAKVTRMPYPVTQVPLARTGPLGTWRVQMFDSAQVASPTAEPVRVGPFLRLNVSVAGSAVPRSDIVAVASSGVSSVLDAWDVSMPTLPIIGGTMNSTAVAEMTVELLTTGVVSTISFDVVRYSDPACTPVGAAVSYLTAYSGCAIATGDTVVENCSSTSGATFTATLSKAPTSAGSVVVRVGGRQCGHASISGTVLSVGDCLPPAGGNLSTAFRVTLEVQGALWWSDVSVHFADDKPGLLSVSGCTDSYPATGTCPFNSTTPLVILGVRLPSSAHVYIDMAGRWPNPQCAVTSSNTTHILCTLSGGLGQAGTLKVVNNGAVVPAKHASRLTVSFQQLKEEECGRTSAGSCDNHGACNAKTGLCECYASSGAGFWFGAACDSCQAMYTNSTGCMARCPGADSPCSNHGVCTNGVCVACDPLFTGAACDVRCPGATLPCNGHGTCAPNGTCVSCTGNFIGAECNVCRPTFIGAACDLPCPLDHLSQVCGAQGQCVLDQGTPRCFCSNGYCGEACNSTVCTACPSGRYGGNCQNECPGGASAPCSGRGNCSEGKYGTGLCACAEGSYGLQCEHQCPRAVLSGAPCNGVASGSCSAAANGCACTATYAGTACETECPGTDMNGTVCSGHGACDTGATGTGTCTCSFGWAGLDCAAPCPGGASTPCSGHGVCHQNATCTCTSDSVRGFWAGDACSGCSGGWAGVSCTVACPRGRTAGDDLIGGSGLVCGGHGTCLSSGDCSCTSTQEDGYWGGTACDTCNPRFFGTTCASLCPGSECSVCSGHGTCNPSTGVCTCMTGSAVTGSWGAAGCDACMSGFYGPLCNKLCPDCGNGACNSGTRGDGQCKCNAGWRTDSAGRCTQCVAGHYGAACTACTAAPNGQICSGNGQCSDGASADGACVCSEGFAGPHCETSCPLVGLKTCAGHGTCTATGCACNTGFVGTDCADCSSVQYGPSCNNTCPACLNRGNCSSGVAGGGHCECPAEYRGTLCDVACPLSNGLACAGHGTCVVNTATATASCTCYANSTHGHFSGSTCAVCDAMYVSASCKTPCPTHNGVVCNGRGTCIDGMCVGCGLLATDTAAYVCGNACHRFGTACLTFNNTCPAGRWGVGCAGTCPGVTDASTGAGACSNLGVCNADTGACLCPAQATGTACEKVCPVVPVNGRPTLCGYGQCVATNKCDCASGYWGPTCTAVCPGGADSPCSGTGTCHGNSGQCTCPTGLAGVACEITCPGGRQNPCTGHGRCRADGSCACDASEATGHYGGDACDVCVPGYGGGDCRAKCSVNSDTDGTVCGCFPTYAGPSCSERCPMDGVACAGHGACFDGHAGNGTCGCEVNYYGAACSVFCDAAVECRAKRGLSNARCTATGLCECERSNIAGYWTGAKCDECVPGYWGPLCNLLCQCNNHGTCDRDSGACQCFADTVQGFWGGSVCEVCLTGYIGSRCQSKNIETSTNAALSVKHSITLPAPTHVASAGLQRFLDPDLSMTYFYGGVSIVASWRPATGEVPPAYLGHYTLPGAMADSDIVAMWAETSRVVALAVSTATGALHQLSMQRGRAVWDTSTPAVTVTALSRGAVALDAAEDLDGGRRLLQLAGTAAPATSVLCAGRDIARGVTAVVTGSRQVQVRRGVNLQVVSLGSVALDAVSVCSVDEGFVVLAGVKASRWAVVAVEIPGGSPVDSLPSTIAAFSIASTSLADSSVKAAVTASTVAIECAVSPGAATASNVAAYLMCGLRTSGEVIALRAEIPAAASRSVTTGGELQAVVACAVPLQDTASDSKISALAFDTMSSQHQALIVLQQTGRAAVMHRLHLTTCIVTGIFTFGRVGGEYEVVQGIFVDSNVREMTAVITVAGRTEFRSLNLFGVREMSPAVLDAAGGTPVRVTGEGFLALGNQTVCWFHDTPSNATLISDTEVVCLSPQVAASPATSGCVVFQLNVAFGTRRTAATNVPYQQIGSAGITAATSGVRAVPFAQAEAATSVTLHGTGFLVSQWAQCRIRTGAGRRIVLSNVTTLSSTKVVCGIPAGVVSTVPPARVEYSHDGVYFGSLPSQTAPFALVGSAANIAVPSPAPGTTFRSGTAAQLPAVTVHIVDSHGNALHHIDAPTTARKAVVAVKRGSLFAASPFPWTSDSATEETVSDGVTVFKSLRLVRPTIGAVSLVVDVGAWRAVVSLTVIVGPPSKLILITGPFAAGATASTATSSWLVGTSAERQLPEAELAVTDAAGNEVNDAAELPPSVLVRWTSATFPAGTAGTAVDVLQRRVAIQTSSRYTFPDIKMRGVFGGTYTLTFEGSGVENLVVQIPVESCNNRTEYGKTGTPLCYQCPALGICDGGTEVLPQPGAWRSRLESYEIYSCFPPHSAGSCDSTGACEDGYLGARCSQCEEGYGKVGLNCVECNDDILNWSMLAFIALVVCGIMYAIVYLTVKQAQRALRGQVVRKDMIAIAYKMALNHVQIAAICVLANDNAGDVLDSFFGSGQKAATVTVDLSFISCTLTPTYRSKLVFMSAAPPVLIIVLAIVRAIQMAIHRGPVRLDVRPEAGIQGPTRNVLSVEKAKHFEHQRPAAMVEVLEADFSVRIARNRQSLIVGTAGDEPTPRAVVDQDHAVGSIPPGSVITRTAPFVSEIQPSEGMGPQSSTSDMYLQPSFDPVKELSTAPSKVLQVPAPLVFDPLSTSASPAASSRIRSHRRPSADTVSNSGMTFPLSSGATPRKGLTPIEPGLGLGTPSMLQDPVSLSEQVSGDDLHTARSKAESTATSMALRRHTRAVVDKGRSKGKRRFTAAGELRRMREENLLKDRPAVVEWVEFVAVAAVVVLFLLYPTILETAAQIFRCETIDYGSDGTRSLLIADRAIDCDGSEYTSLMGIALPVLVAYGVGLPVAVVLFVYGFRYATLKGNMAGAIQLFGYVTGGYRRERWWWETVIFARKFVLSIGAVLFTDNRLRTYFMMWTLGISVVGAAVSQSYENFMLSVLEALSLSTIAATVNVLLLYDFYSESSDPGQFWAVTASVIVVNVAMMLGLLIILAMALRRKLEELVQDDPIGNAWIQNTLLRVPLPALNFFVTRQQREVTAARKKAAALHRRMTIVDSLADAADRLPQPSRGLITAVKMYRKLQQGWLLRFDLSDLGPDVLLSLYEHEAHIIHNFMHETDDGSDGDGDEQMAASMRQEMLRKRSVALHEYFRTHPLDDGPDPAEMVDLRGSFDADAQRREILESHKAGHRGLVHRVGL